MIVTGEGYSCCEMLSDGREIGSNCAKRYFDVSVIFKSSVRFLKRSLQILNLKAGCGLEKQIRKLLAVFLRSRWTKSELEDP